MSTHEPPPSLTALTEQERLFQEVVRDFAKTEVAPRVRKMDEARAIDPDLVERIFELGLMGLEAPEHLGGADAGFFSSVVAVEELARVDPSVAVLVDVQNTLVVNALLRWGTEKQHARHLPRLTSDTIGAYALSETGAGSDAFSLRCRARPDGDEWILDGVKTWITNGADAGLVIVFATVDPDAGYKGITAFLVDCGAEGFSVGKKEDKLGIRASSTAELIFDGVRVGAGDVLGEVGSGYRVAIETLNEGRIGIGAQMLGLAQGAFDHALRYVREREQFGRAIGSFQSVQFELAEMATELEAARLLVYNAARLRGEGKRFVAEAAMAKLFASEVAQRVASRCIDLHGGYGFTTEYPVEKLYRDAKIGTIYEGTSNMQKQTIAKVLMT